MRTNIALFEHLQRDDSHNLLLLFGCFFAFCALVTLIYWVLTSGEGIGVDRQFSHRLNGGQDQHSHSNGRDDLSNQPNLVEPHQTESQILASQRYNAISAFRTEVDAGHVYFDEVYSIVYQYPPREIDNLQAIQGISVDGEAYLNSFGCYTFKQIANWSPETCEKISHDLNLVDVLRRDDWIIQAHRLYRQKYGEPIRIPS